MPGSVRIARIAGIDVEAHWSWLFIVALIVWSLAAGAFPHTNPGLGRIVGLLSPTDALRVVDVLRR
jgi:hypothetical protein